MYPYRNILPLIHQNMKCHRFTISYYMYNFNHDDIYCWIQNNTSDKVYKHIRPVMSHGQISITCIVLLNRVEGENNDLWYQSVL